MYLQNQNLNSNTIIAFQFLISLWYFELHIVCISTFFHGIKYFDLLYLFYRKKTQPRDMCNASGITISIDSLIFY